MLKWVLNVAQDMVQWWGVVNTVMNFWVPYKVGNFLIGQVTASLSRRTVFHGDSYMTRLSGMRTTLCI